MAKPSTRSSFEVANLFGDFVMPSVDVEAIAEAQRKNVEALLQANQLAVEGARALAQRQAEIVQQVIEETSGMLRRLREPGALEDRLAKNAEAAKEAFEKGIANVRELRELGTKASVDVFSVLARRVSEGFDEVRLYAKKQAAAG